MGHHFPSVSAVARRPAQHHRRTPSRTFTAPAGEISNVTGYNPGVPPRQEVIFKDGTCMWLLAVHKNGQADRYLRELGLPAGGVLVDLRKLVPTLAADLAVANARDVPGLVHFSLRQRFTGMEALIEAAVASWRP
jgi:hypothetical protein